MTIMKVYVNEVGVTEKRSCWWVDDDDDAVVVVVDGYAKEKHCVVEEVTWLYCYCCRIKA